MLGRTLGAARTAVDVTASAGVVTLSGQVDRHSAAQITAHLAAQVSGVVQVVDGLTYEFDDLNPVSTSSPVSAAPPGCSDRGTP